MMAHRYHPEEAQCPQGPYNRAFRRPPGRAASPTMFDKLPPASPRSSRPARRGRLTEENIGDTLRQVRMALLEADVALPVVKEFIEAVRARAIGLEVHRSLTRARHSCA